MAKSYSIEVVDETDLSAMVKLSPVAEVAVFPSLPNSPISERCGLRSLNKPLSPLTNRAHTGCRRYDTPAPRGPCRRSSIPLPFNVSFARGWSSSPRTV